jgi:hypothetical protein
MPVTIRPKLAGTREANTLKPTIPGYACNPNIMMATTTPRGASLIVRHCKLVEISPKSIEVAIENLGKRGNGHQKPVAVYRATYVDLQYNQIKSTLGLEIFTAAQNVNLSTNKLYKLVLANDFQFRFLTHLNLANNAFKEIPWRELHQLSNLVDLNMSNNDIVRIGDPRIDGNVLQLRCLVLMGNKITDLKGVEAIVTLDHLDVSKNLIVDIKSISVLQVGVLLGGINLQSLCTRGNSVEESPCFKHTCIDTFPSLRLLNRNILLPKPEDRISRNSRQFCLVRSNRCDCKSIGSHHGLAKNKEKELISIESIQAEDTVKLKMMDWSSSTNEESKVAKLSNGSICYQQKASELTVDCGKRRVLSSKRSRGISQGQKQKLNRKPRSKKVPLHKNGEKQLPKKITRRFPFRPQATSTFALDRIGIGIEAAKTSKNCMPLRLLGKNKKRTSFERFSDAIAFHNLLGLRKRHDCPRPPRRPWEEKKLQTYQRGRKIMQSDLDGWSLSDGSNSEDPLFQNHGNFTPV